MDKKDIDEARQRVRDTHPLQKLPVKDLFPFLKVFGKKSTVEER